MMECKDIPHKRWEYIKTFPKHFHNGQENEVGDSFISDEPAGAIKEVLEFVRKNINF